MLRWFKKHFIPHISNDHQPHFLRANNARFLIFIVFAVECLVLLLPYIPALNFANNPFTAAVLPSVLGDLTNKNRQAEHLPTLTVNSLLNRVAELKAEDMAAKGYFAHVSPDGTTPWYWFKQVGYNYEYAGENLAVDFSDSKDVALAWMNSPTHRANIIKNAYTEVGTGVAAGTYQGNPTIFVAQVYAKPASVVTNEPIVEPVKVLAKATSEAEVLNATVLGAESIAVATQTPATAAPIVAEQTVDTTPAQPYVKTNIFEKFAVSPRHALNVIFVIIGMLVVLAIFLKLVIRTDKRHPILITNGLIVLMLIFGAYAINNYVAKSKMTATTSFAGFSGEQFDHEL